MSHAIQEGLTVQQAIDKLIDTASGTAKLAKACAELLRVLREAQENGIDAGLLVRDVVPRPWPPTNLAPRRPVSSRQMKIVTTMPTTRTMRATRVMEKRRTEQPCSSHSSRSRHSLPRPCRSYSQTTVQASPEAINTTVFSSPGDRKITAFFAPKRFSLSRDTHATLGDGITPASVFTADSVPEAPMEVDAVYNTPPAPAAVSPTQLEATAALAPTSLDAKADAAAAALATMQIGTGTSTHTARRRRLGQCERACRSTQPLNVARHSPSLLPRRTHPSQAHPRRRPTSSRCVNSPIG